MAILNFSSPCKYLIGGFFFLCLHSCTSVSEGTATIKVDSVNSHFNTMLFFDYNPMYSFNYINVGDKVYVCTKKTDSMLVLADVFDENRDYHLGVSGEINSIGSNDSTLFILSNNNILSIFHFSDTGLARTKPETKYLASIFSDSLFVKRGTSTSLVPLSGDSLMVPYGAANSTMNYLDKNSYILMSFSDTSAFRPIVKTPVEYLSDYEYYTDPVADYSVQNHSIYYTFNKKNYLYKLTVGTGILDSVSIPNFVTTPYDQKKITSFTYMRKYMYMNDKNYKIICGEKTIYLITRKRDKSYDIRLYTAELKPIGVTNCKTHLLLPEMAFLKDKKLYVPTQKNSFYCFYIDNEL